MTQPDRPTSAGVILLAIGAAGMGIRNLIHTDFVAALEPAPAGLPGRRIWACLIGVYLVVSAIALLFRRTSRPAAIALGSMFLLWIVAFHLPRVVLRPTNIGAWIAPCETLALGCAAWLIAIRRWDRVGTARKVAVGGRILFGLSLLLFGLSHIKYHEIVAEMVPVWIPGRPFWAWFTGAGHLAAGLSLVTNVASRLAANLFGVMVGGFILLLHIPQVLAAPAGRQEWESLLVAVSVAGAAWIVAGSHKDQPRQPVDFPASHSTLG